MSRWLARLSFSFLILAVLLAWQGYKVASGRIFVDARWATLYWIGAAVALGLFLAGVRQRHRPD